MDPITSLRPEAVPAFVTLWMLLFVLVLILKFGRWQPFEFVLVGLLSIAGAYFTAKQFHPVHGDLGTLLVGLVTIVGVPLAWLEYRTRWRDSRTQMFMEAHRAFITDKELTSTAILIECFNDLIEKETNPIKKLLDRELTGDLSRTSDELNLNRQIDTFLSYLNDMCAVYRRGWIGKREFEDGMWAYYATSVTDTEKDSLAKYVSDPAWGWYDLVETGNRLRPTYGIRARQEAANRAEVDAQRTIHGKALVTLRQLASRVQHAVRTHPL